MAAVPGASLSGLRGAVDLSPLVARQSQPSPSAPSGASAEGAPGDGAPVAGVVVEVGEADLARVVELSRTVPVVLAVVAPWSTPSQELLPALQHVVEEAAGRLVLGVVDHDANPQLVADLQAQAVPTVVAVIAGRPVPLFAGAVPEDQLRPLFEQVLALAAQNGVTGSVPMGEGAAAPAEEPQPEPLPPLHAEAYEAIGRQDYTEAARLFRTAIAQDPRDTAAVAALAQVELLDRLQSLPEDARTRAASDTKDVEAALAVADLDMAGGHVEDAFARLLDTFAVVAGDDRTVLRTRLLDFFAMIGADDPRVAAARRRLTSLLY
ncbi:tetratricopeptide repeat protein [Amnibacterium sp. CER49]|uniref:co-chaperone YbbN n=1 Tax=Amnibacterium sp. CER49 TaxID=3039161 RepID=UPI002448052A|nr:tetratricopeptide repeat protein [Amnibacterium sp. CER49]MDH2442713.1 tetratricopeptide repeat protein [Amnibacterium sp. CER49]